MYIVTDENGNCGVATTIAQAMINIEVLDAYITMDELTFYEATEIKVQKEEKYVVVKPVGSKKKGAK